MNGDKQKEAGLVHLKREHEKVFKIENIFILLSLYFNSWQTSYQAWALGNDFAMLRSNLR